MSNKVQAVTFDDVLISPKFSRVSSRKEAELTTTLGSGAASIELRLPVISANMETITGPDMAVVMDRNGGLGILHRFCTIEENIKLFKETTYSLSILSHSNQPVENRVGVSIGIGAAEKERADALVTAGARILCVDVAHGAQIGVVEQVRWLRQKYSDNVFIIVGNFATPSSIEAFELELFNSRYKPDIYKVGIGPGSVCTTRIKTGVGIPQLSAILSCAEKFPIIADGGMKSPGDIAKALGAGAKAVMLAGMLSGTTETPGDVVYGANESKFKIFKGSASGDYGNGWKTSEGIVTEVPYVGSVSPILKDIEGGLRSALTYTGSKNLTEFKDNCDFILVSSSAKVENGPHKRG